MMRHLREQNGPAGRESGSGFFRAGVNCLGPSRLYQGAVLVDYANYYRALYSSILKARHSIFILGWDIDSRVRLLRGEDAARAPAPVTAGDLLAWKGAQNPGMKIHLLRWDSSFMFLTSREMMAEWAWASKTPDNVHVLLDETIPAGGSHHQKVVVVDDEVAFSGGMDIALERWDNRSHKPHSPHRRDAGRRYGPYHDIQVAVAGPVVRDLAMLARWRWRNAAGYKPLSPRAPGGSRSAPPPAWPDGVAPHFHDAPCAIARTIPRMGRRRPVFEVHRMYLDLIGQAERFIYCENQFLSFRDVAEALNARLKARPGLRVLIVSSCEPRGLFENKVFWAGRVRFRQTLEDGIDPARVKMAYPAVYDRMGRDYYKRIHSKLLVIDDRYMMVASSNINNRSMAADTECDVVIEAETPRHAEVIRALRDDLIAEHTGLDRARIARMIRAGAPVTAFLGGRERNRCVLHEVDDSAFVRNAIRLPVGVLADPDMPLFANLLPFAKGATPVRNPRRKLFLASFLFFVLLALGAGWLVENAAWLRPERLRAFLETYRGTHWGLPVVCLVYLAGGFVMFPVTVLSLATAVVFGAVWGPVYAMCGALASAALFFGIGHAAGFRVLRRYVGERVRNIDNKIRKNGISGVVAVRILPIAPFTVVNLAIGMSSVRFADFMAGTFLGLLPGLVAKGLVGDSLIRVFLSPTPATAAYLLIGVTLWAALVVGAQKIVSRLRARREEQAGAKAG